MTPLYGGIVRQGLGLFRIVKVYPDGTYLMAMVGYGTTLWTKD